MSNIVSLIKDIIISAVIAVLTSGLFEVSNIVYQSIITVLILIIIFLILRRIDKMAKRLQILSVLYVEHFLIPLFQKIDKNGGVEVEGKLISKVKVFIILPDKLSEVHKIKEQLNLLNTIDLGHSEATNRSLTVTAKLINDEQLQIFDTPISWNTGLDHMNKAKGMTEKKFSKLIVKMTDDIKSYVTDLPNSTLDETRLSFIDLEQFRRYFD